jgi:hypothetical protein
MATLACRCSAPNPLFFEPLPKIVSQCIRRKVKEKVNIMPQHINPFLFSHDKKIKGQTSNIWSYLEKWRTLERCASKNDSINTWSIDHDYTIDNKCIAPSPIFGHVSKIMP